MVMLSMFTYQIILFDHIKIVGKFKLLQTFVKLIVYTHINIYNSAHKQTYTLVYYTYIKQKFNFSK